MAGGSPLQHSGELGPWTDADRLVWGAILFLSNATPAEFSPVMECSPLCTRNVEWPIDGQAA